MDKNSTRLLALTTPIAEYHLTQLLSLVFSVHLGNRNSKFRL